MTVTVTIIMRILLAILIGVCFYLLGYCDGYTICEQEEVQKEDLEWNNYDYQ